MGRAVPEDDLPGSAVPESDLPNFAVPETDITPVTTTEPTADASVSMAPQMASAAQKVGGLAVQGAQAVPGLVKQGAQAVASMTPGQLTRGAIDIGSMMAGHPPYATIAKQVLNPNAAGIGETASKIGSMARQGASALGSGARALGGAVAQGVMAPESLMMAPYQMAAYEQDKIRANPTAPGLQNNPYAQQFRGEYATQGQAAAANRRQAIGGQQYGGLSSDEQQMLKIDRELSFAMRLKAAKKVLGQQ